MRELVDEGDGRAAGEHRVHVELGEPRAPVLDVAAGDGLDPLGLARSERSAVGLQDADHDVGAALLAPPALGEHGHGLADAGGGAEIDAKSSASHGSIVSQSGSGAVPRAVSP